MLAFRPRSLSPFPVLALLGTATACGGNSTGPAEFGLRHARELWRQAAILDYSITVGRRCVCDGANRPVVVQVSGGAVVSMTDAQTGDPIEVSAVGPYPSVEGMFEILQNAVDTDAHDIIATYQIDFGYPLELQIDFDRETKDEELGYVTLVFERQ